MYPRVLSVSLLAALLAALVCSAQEKGRPDRPARDKQTSIARVMYQGKIQLVDPDKRTVVLDDALPYGKTGKVRPHFRIKDRPAKAPAAQKLTFSLTRDARVTLDGRRAQLKELKAGQYARIRVVSGRAGLDRRDSAEPPAVRVADRKDTPAPTVLSADLVEASTEAFPAGTDKRD
jgi:hypothetical protein